jgi:GST-like protein
MTAESAYIPPKVWTWNKGSGGRFANINRPIAGPTHDKALPVGKHPLQLYSLGTPNGVKVTVMLEELLALGREGAEYDAWLIRIQEGDQFGSGFVEVNPNSKIPALLDRSGSDPIRVFESGAILLYLASKTGKLLPIDMAERWTCVQWLMWQMGGLGPMMGQANHFRRYAKDKIQYAIDRYSNEANRLTNVLDKRLAEARYTAGKEYSISDIAIFPWLRGADQRGVNIEEYPNVKRWFEEINARPAVQRGCKVLSEAAAANTAPHSDKSWEIMFGKVQFEKR